MMDEDMYVVGEVPSLPGDVVRQLHRRQSCFHHHYSDTWDLENGGMGIVEGLIAAQEG
jgi:hypothetical protein